MRNYQISDVISIKYQKQISVRLNETLKRVKVIHPALDIGKRNVVSEAIGIYQSTDFDLNWEWKTDESFMTITCFEVIEHVQNPLLLLSEIYKHLRINGCLYLTTPHRWIMGKGKYHFHEYTTKELVSLLKEVGFNIVEIDRIQAYNFKLTGLRPIIRKLRDLLFGQCIFIKAIKS